MALKTKQQGVVLLVSLVFLIALTAVVSVLMQNTTTDFKMAGATQDRVTATQDVISATEKVIFDQISRTNGNNSFALQANAFPVPQIAMPGDVTVDIDIASPDSLSVECPRSSMSSSVDLLKCNVLKIQVTKRYGRSNSSNLDLNSGVAQQILNVGN